LFTSFTGGARHGTARDTVPGPGVGEHLHRVVGVGAEGVQDSAESMTDFRLPVGLRVRGGLVQ